MTRRFETWVVTGFLLLGAGYFFLSRQLHEWSRETSSVVEVVLDPVFPRPSGLDPAGNPAARLPFTIAEARWSEGGGGHWLLELRVRYRNEGSKEETLGDARVSLVTETGQPVPPYFLAGTWPPEVAAGAEEAVDLRYWVENATADGKLWLQVGNDRVPVDGRPADKS